MCQSFRIVSKVLSSIPSRRRTVLTKSYLSIVTVSRDIHPGEGITYHGGGFLYPDPILNAQPAIVRVQKDTLSTLTPSFALVQPIARSELRTSKTQLKAEAPLLNPTPSRSKSLS